MRSLAVLCILVVVCTVSVATISPGMAPGIKVLTTIDPHEISLRQPNTTLMGLLSITSTPSGATVLIDGSSTLNGAPIPLTDFSSLPIVSGLHSITVKHTGYVDYSSTFSVSPGGTTSVPVQLSPLNLRANQLNPVVAGGAVAQNIEVNAIAANPPATSVPTPTPTLLPCPSGYVCESLAKAQADYGTGGYTTYSSTLPCNYTTARALSKEQVREYCIRPTGKPLERITLKPIRLEPVGVVNAGTGKPGLVCTAGYTLCTDTYCYDLSSNPAHCGNCTITCASNQTCTSGRCTSIGNSNLQVKPVLPVPAVRSPLVITHVASIDSFIDTISSGFFGLFLPPSPPGSPPGVNPDLQAQKSITGGYIVTPVIEQGATIFIGEQGLDVTHALNEAYGSERDSVPAATTIGYWASEADVYTTAPAKTLDLSSRYKSLTVAPSDFVGYSGIWDPNNLAPGSWYLVDRSTGHAMKNGLVFNVMDPCTGAITLRKVYHSMQQGADRIQITDLLPTNPTVPRGDIVNLWLFSTNLDNFHVRTNRGPLSWNDGDDGFIDLRLQDPSGALLTSVESRNGYLRDPMTLNLLQNCGYDEWYDRNICCIPSHTGLGETGIGWDTGAKDSNGQYIYPTGTYTIWAESHLNNMYNNYRNGGQPYIGKTASEKVTMTLV